MMKASRPIKLTGSQKELINQILSKASEITYNSSGNEPEYYPYRKLLDTVSGPKNKSVKSVSTGIFTKIIQPTVLACKSSGGQDESTKMTVLIAAFINTEKVLQNSDFSFYYDFSLSMLGEPQLNIYITFNDEIQGEEYNCYSFELGFESDPKILSQWQLDGVGTIQVFLYDKDPKTSRGTVTTVQSGG